MKMKFIISVLMLFMGLIVMGQTSSTVQTPWGTSVDVSTPENDMTPYQRNQWDINHSPYEDSGAYFHPTLYGDVNYPWPSSTSTFNCHGYAWHMSWLGEVNEFDSTWNMTDTEAENYFDDPSYKECTKAEAEIWWINNGTHSALATSITDELKSKWGTGPLATHDKDNQPYTISSVTYYKRCYYKLSQTFTTDETKEYCKVEFYNTNLSSNVDLEISFEDWILIEGTFSTGIGSTLEIYPE
jgi:hypothetical protein